MVIEKGSVTPLRNILKSKEYVDVCLAENAYVICVNKGAQKSRSMPFRAMHGNDSEFWLRRSKWEFFFLDDDIKKLEGKMAGGEYAPRLVVNDEVDSADVPLDNVRETDARYGFGSEYEAIVRMDDNLRVKYLKKDKERLDGLIAMKPRQEQLVATALVETARDAILHNHASMVSAMSLPSQDAKKKTQGLVDSTKDLLGSSLQLIRSSVYNSDLMNMLVSKSNGTIIQHMTRVYLNGLAFLSYFNKYISGSNVVSKLRLVFNERYRRFYGLLLPHIHRDQITLERVFLGGMRMVDEMDFYNWAMGFLLHDIGKAASVEYHESDAAYNRDVVMEHVRVGFSNVAGKTTYPQEAALITGYHHEYYGDQNGYGIFRTYLTKHKEKNAFLGQNHCMAYDIKPVLSFKVLAYFPAKVLEIADVFDSLTDPNRKYRKAVGTEEALKLMREEFIIKHQKIDIILFDIFSNFARKTQTTWHTQPGAS